MDYDWYRAAEVKGHKLRLDDEGRVDNWAVEYDHHNGPMCVLCDEYWCEHCTKPEDIDPCDGGEANRLAAIEREAKQVTEDAMLIAAANTAFPWADMSQSTQNRYRNIAQSARAKVAAALKGCQ